MDQRQIKLLEEFLETLDIEGVCGFWVDKERDDEDSVWVYMVLDTDWIKSVPTKPGFVANRMRLGLAEEISKFLGIEVRVGSTVSKCNKINETIKDIEMNNESEFKDFIVESISEEMFVLRRKIEIISKVLRNYENIDCSKQTGEAYQRVFCENMKDWSFSKVENLLNHLKTKLNILIRDEIRKNKSMKK